MSETLRILMHDYGGYPYPFQLSCWLAQCGHEVLHVHNDNEPPRGIAGMESERIDGLRVEAIRIDSTFAKEDFYRRHRHDLAFGRRLCELVATFAPDVILSANSPVETQEKLVRAARKRGIPFVFWVQDLRGLAAYGILSRKIPLLGRWIGAYYLWLERRQARRSDAAILITDAFASHIAPWAQQTPLHVIPNWAPLDALPVLPKENEWTRRHGIDSTFNFVFAGVLGMKHNPALLLDLAQHLKTRPEARLVIVSQGSGVEWLRARKESLGLENLLLIDFQPFGVMPQVMAGADVLLAVLEPEAGVYSVPSKVQAYMCAKRALLLSVPEKNRTARVVGECAAGLVVPPNDSPALLAAADRLLNDAALRETCAANARTYAETHFDMDEIGHDFLQILQAVVARRHSGGV